MSGHTDYRQMMSLALDGRLEAVGEAALEHHLEECAACAAAWEAMRGLDVLLEQAGLAEPLPGFEARVMARIRARQVERHRTEKAARLALVALVGAVVLVQWVPALVSLVGGWGLLGPLEGLAGWAGPVLATGRALRTALDVLGGALGLWLAYVVSLPLTWAAGLVTLALAATWVGLVGVFGPHQGRAVHREVGVY